MDGGFDGGPSWGRRNVGFESLACSPNTILKG